MFWPGHQSAQAEYWYADLFQMGGGGGRLFWTRQCEAKIPRIATSHKFTKIPMKIRPVSRVRGLRCDGTPLAGQIVSKSCLILA